MNFKKYIHLLPPQIALSIDIFLALAVAFGIYLYAEKQIVVENERRMVSLKLTNQLRHNSDDLTRMAVTYVVTGDPRYKQYYRDILAIQGGTKARPANYINAYWDLVLANAQPPQSNNEVAISMFDLMRQHGFNEEELSNLAGTTRDYDNLAAIELNAMKLVEAGGKDLEVNRRKAILMLHDDNYHHAKAGVMARINEFHQQMEMRTQAAIRKAKLTAIIFMMVFSVGLLAATALILIAYVGLRTKLGASAEEVQAHMSKMGLGEFSSPPPDTPLIKDSVLAGLFEMQTKLHALEIERSLSAAVLLQSQADLEEAQRIAHIGSWQMDPAFNHVTWTAELYRIFGLNPALPPPGYEEQSRLFTAESWERLNLVMSGTRESGTPYALELEMIRTDGTRGWILARGEALKSASGDIIQLHGVAADISERKQAEFATQVLRDQLIQSTKMEAVGHLTAGIAHDFNNLLGAIMGYSELSKLKIATNNTDVVDNYMDEILKAGNRAKELISQMLAFSRVAPDAKGTEAPVTLLTPVIKEVAYLMRSSIPSTINLHYQVDDQNIKARIQSVNLHQIIMNLGINARDAIGEYGNITISLSRQHFCEQVCDSCQHAFKGEFARLTVSDTGSGIPEHILKNIFNPFFTTKGVGKGTGMGLAVVHGLVHGLGGHIQVESLPGKGTAISVLLPLVTTVEAGEDSHTTADSTSVTLVGMNIMVVDDELAMTAMLREVLSTHGAQVLAFNSPLAAWSVFEQESDEIDVVITDETMPGLSGMHLAERMLKHRPGMPIILCTGYSEHATPELAEQAGLAGFFYKPLKMIDLLQKLRRILQQRDMNQNISAI